MVTSAGAAILGTALDPNSAEPMHRQLYDALRQAVLSGRLAPGTRLASTRAMAAELGVSRNTIMAAFEQLLAEGYLEGRIGAGTYVTRTLPDDILRARSRPRPVAPRGSRRRSIARRGRTMIATPVSHARTGPPRAFRVGTPAIDEFPFETWSRIVARRWREPTRDLLGYGDPAGYRPLREAIAARLAAVRGVRCDADQVLIVSGSQQALDLTARMLLEDGDTVWIEDPGYIGARASFAGAGARIVPVPVDGEGLDVESGASLHHDAALAYVTPAHQYPAGVTMTLARMLALLRWARSAGAWILEDDYDSEYRYGGRPLAALQSLDDDGRVIYMGTFSKVLLPSLRLGYLVLPPDLVDSFVAARAVADRHSPLIEQAALAEFITDGHLDRHVRRMRMLYAERQQVLLESVASEADGMLDLHPANAGMHLAGYLPDGYDDVAASSAAYDAGVETVPISTYRMQRDAGRGGLVLGYACVTPEDIRIAARRLGRALASLQPRRRRVR